MGNNDFVFVKEDWIYIKVYVRDILFIKCNGDYMELHVKGKRFMVHSTISAILDKMPKDFFVQINRSVAVMMHLVERVEDNTVYINGVAIPIGGTFKDNVKINMNIL